MTGTGIRVVDSGTVIGGLVVTDNHIVIKGNSMWVTQVVLDRLRALEILR